MNTIFTKKNCGPCQSLKRLLDYKKVEYVEKDIENQTNALEAVARTGYLTAPTSIINGQIIPGFNQVAILEALSPSVGERI